MNLTIDGKQKVNQFLRLLKIFSYPLIICDCEKMQFSEMPENQSFNEFNKTDSPAFFAQLDNDFFTQFQTQIRENHLLFTQPHFSNIELQQEVSILNSQLKYICSYIPTDIIYKSIKPLIKSQIKQLKLSFAYMISDSYQEDKKIQLQFMIATYSEDGYFTIMKPISQLTPRIFDLPLLQNKVISFNYLSCKTILTQMKSHSIQLNFSSDNIQFNPISFDSELVEIPSNTLSHYDQAFIENVYGELQIELIYSRTYIPIFNFSQKYKLDCQIYINPSKQFNNKNAIFYFVYNQQYMMLCSRQQAIVNNQSKPQAKIFHNPDLIKEIQLINSSIKQNKADLQYPTTHHKNTSIYIYDNPPLKMVCSDVMDSNTKIYHQQEPLLFVPPKVTGSISQAIQDFMTRQSCQQLNATSQKYSKSFQN
ncbi:unnamed protein product (macronuclear) [Paramecium tetraurelia]|uniref:Uncharacterized protein n=1 Tax=Paramecium tetraurelia TaxID=5888 RepID=A0DEJ4_PARTE|nr:uncharacterized protein GSPATT00016287001 [Paramecium tetraurelia]CAK81461.1 unnamed protein product [Paramecium tetraurelia]|eukprot:XP_001448858.1 hypothetical protein (macronuclear) [Paramecium tetraurelia strain d4-2]